MATASAFHLFDLTASAAAAGVPERAIMAQTGHKRTDTLRKYLNDRVNTRTHRTSFTPLKGAA
jgi:hypothetical protein